MIEWKNPNKELPPDKAFVACLKYHWKNCWPLSVEIIFGEVESYLNEDGVRIVRVNTNDFTGGGSYCWYFHPGETFGSDIIDAWAYSKDFKRPDFLNHEKHWGKEK